MTDEQIDAIFDDSPFTARRKMDKSGYEVVKMENEDWRVCISDEQTRVGEFDTYEEAVTSQRRMHVRWVLGADFK